MKKIYSDEFRSVLLNSRSEAMKNGDKLIRADHFVLGILHEPDNDAFEIISQKVSSLDPLRAKMKEHLKTYGDVHARVDNSLGAINLDMEAGLALQNCSTESTLMHMDKVTSGHLLQALLRDENSFVAKTLAEHGITYNYLREQLKDRYHDGLIKHKDAFNADEDDFDETEEAADSKSVPLNLDADESEKYDDEEDTMRVGGQNKSSKRPIEFLKKYGVDMTLEAIQGKLDPVVGRELEIERLSQVLSRRKKNNPVLIGEAGVGKTAIVEGLAQRIVEGNVPYVLEDKRIISLNVASIMAGTKYRGQLESRLEGIVKELEEHHEVILFIDEIHTIMRAGAVEGGAMDIANIMKPALSRGTVQCIGATTIDEYRKTIEKDGAMDRRFQKIMVEQPTVDETISILHNIKERYEMYHNVKYTDKAIEACAKLTERYMSNRKLPDKAIDALDEAGSRKHIVEAKKPECLKSIEDEIGTLNKLKMRAADEKKYGTASELRDRIASLKETAAKEKATWLSDMKKKPLVVGERDIEQAVSIMSGVPVHKMAQSESVMLRKLKKELQSSIIAQDKAIEKLVKAITRNRIGLRDPNKPIGTFMFLGPTGVGKTYLVKKLAEYMFGSADALIRIDMSEYMEKFSASRLVGAPPGYVGYEDGGQLTEKVRRRPYSIVLLDEIEKAHKDVFNMLLQVMDDGRLTDSNGVTVDFRNTIIIMTSNCGSRELQDFGNGVGFSVKSEADQKQYADSIIMKSLNKQFAPEFINRIDDIILFDSLSRKAIGQIVENELEKLGLRLMVLGFSLQIDKKAMQFLVDKSYDRKYGARPLKRALQTYVEDGLSDYLLDGRSKANKSGVIHITKKSEQEELCFE